MKHEEKMVQSNLSSSLLRKTQRKTVPFVLALAVLVLTYFLLPEDLERLFLFGALIIIFSIYKFDSRILVVYAILLLLIAGALTSHKADDSAEQIGVLSYWFLVAGVISILIDFYRMTTIKTHA